MAKPKEKSKPNSLGEISQKKLHPTIAALDEAGASLEDADWIRRPGNAARIVEFMRTKWDDEAFADEATDAAWEYPPEFKIKPVEEQAALLAKHFPGLDMSHVSELERRYDWWMDHIDMDGIVVIPKQSALAGLSPPWGGEAMFYTVALQMVMKALNAERPWKRDPAVAHWTTWQHNRPNEASFRAMELFEKVPGDVFLLRVQMGRKFGGMSVRRARSRFGPREFGLDAFAVSCILLTHPSRMGNNKLWVVCAGSEFAPEEECFTDVPAWKSGGNSLEPAYPHRVGVDECSPCVGVATAILPYY